MKPTDLFTQLMMRCDVAIDPTLYRWPTSEQEQFTRDMWSNAVLGMTNYSPTDRSAVRTIIGRWAPKDMLHGVSLFLMKAYKPDAVSPQTVKARLESGWFLEPALLRKDTRRQGVPCKRPWYLIRTARNRGSRADQIVSIAGLVRLRPYADGGRMRPVAVSMFSDWALYVRGDKLIERPIPPQQKVLTVTTPRPDHAH